MEGEHVAVGPHQEIPGALFFVGQSLARLPVDTWRPQRSCPLAFKLAYTTYVSVVAKTLQLSLLRSGGSPLRENGKPHMLKFEGRRYAQW